MLVAYRKVLDLLLPVKMGGQEMEDGEGVAYGKHSGRRVRVCAQRGREARGG